MPGPVARPRTILRRLGRQRIECAADDVERAPVEPVPEANETIAESSSGGVAGDPALGDKPEAKRRRKASNIVIQEIMGQLRAFGAVVGPRSTPCAEQEAEGFEISQMDVDDAERGILYESVNVESAEFFGVYPGFAMDLHGLR